MSRLTPAPAKSWRALDSSLPCRTPPRYIPPTVLAKGGLPGALRLSCFVVGERGRGVLSRWRSDPSSWEIHGHVGQCRLPFSSSPVEESPGKEKVLTHEPSGHDDLQIHTLCCLVFFNWGVHFPMVHSSVLCSWRKPATNSLTLHGLFKALKEELATVPPHGHDKALAL